MPGCLPSAMIGSRSTASPGRTFISCATSARNSAAPMQGPPAFIGPSILVGPSDPSTRSLWPPVAFFCATQHRSPRPVIPAGETDEPSIRIAWTRRDTGETTLNDAVAALAATEGKGGRKPSILILGRYRFLRPDVERLQRQNPGATITFKTIHASKGLEADHVIILGVDNAKMGFPSMIVDDPLLSLVSPEAERYPNAEERRVMYVAVTRARRTVTILAAEARPSVFVEELMKEPAYGVSSPQEVLARTHTCA